MVRQYIQTIFNMYKKSLMKCEADVKCEKGRSRKLYIFFKLNVFAN